MRGSSTKAIEASLPLHVTSLGTTQSQDTVLSEDIQTERVDPFLVDHNEVLLLFFRVNSLIADEVLQLDDFSALGIRELSL